MRTPTTTDVFHNPLRYGDMRSWRQEVVGLHADGPVHLIDAEGFSPFWVVIGHDAVMEVERQPALFTNEPVPVLANDAALELQREQGMQIRTLIHMDRPDHTEYRKLTNDWFKPASVRRLTDRLDELSRQAVAKHPISISIFRCDRVSEFSRSRWERNATRRSRISGSGRLCSA